MAVDSDALRQQLDRLRAKFAAGLPQLLAEAEALVATLHAGDAGALPGLRQIVHRLHGTGGTMGFTALSQAAAALELRLDACLQAGALGPDDPAAIAAGLDAVKATIAGA